MTVACIVQARLGSARLPAKVLLPLPTGRTVLEEVLFRCKQIPGVDVVVCAIPDTADNDILVRLITTRWTTRWRLQSGLLAYPIVRGPEHDVLARYAKAAEAVNADIIMRITADCPLIDPQVCGRVLSLFKESGVGYASNAWPMRTYPHGFDCEVFSRGVLERANKEVQPYSRGTVDERIFTMDMTALAQCGYATIDVANVRRAAEDREHVCLWMQRQPDIEKLHVGRPVTEEDRSHLRWTLDTLEDYVRIWGVMEEQMREAA